MSSRSCLAAWLALTIGCAASAEWKEGDLLPELRVEGVPALAGRVVLIDFWASWCAPCKASFPHLDQMYKDYAGRGLVVLGVNVDDEASAMRKFLERTPVSFPVVRDAGQRLVAQADVPTMPTSFLVDRQGRIRKRHVGFSGEETTRELRAEIEGLLHE
jgi:thiol-disulfide isomerase/thioredoxin